MTDQDEAARLLRAIVDTIPAAYDVNGVILAAHQYLATPPSAAPALNQQRPGI